MGVQVGSTEFGLQRSPLRSCTARLMNAGGYLCHWCLALLRWVLIEAQLGFSRIPEAVLISRKKILISEPVSFPI